MGGLAEERPGKSGTALGAKALRLSGVQSASRVASHVVALVSMLAIAAVLGPADLGAYALLIFLAAVVTQLLGVSVRPGMLRRTFGAADDEDGGDGEDEDDEVSATPTRTLGTGLVLATVLGLIAVGIVVALAVPLEKLLLGDYGGGTTTMVIWAGVLGASFAVAKLAAISLWFEHRASAFVIVELVRPIAALALLVLFLALDFGVTGALAATAIGAMIAALLGVALLWGSFEICLDRKEAVEIFKVGRQKAPVLLSLWFTQSADIFFVSRYVDPASVGVYNFGARLGGASALLPQGLRLALRPLRKTALFPAARDQYGRSILDGLILTYFLLLAVIVVFLMVLLAPIAAELAPEGFGDIGPLIPLAAASTAMPVLLRTVYGSTSWPGKTHKSLVVAALGSVTGFIVLNIVLGPHVGIYTPPIAALISFGTACTVLLVRGQRSRKKIDIHWTELLKAVLFAAVIGGAYILLVPDILWLEIVAATVAALVFVGLVIVGGAVPRQHREAWRNIVHLGVRGGGGVDGVDPKIGLMSLSRRERNFLRRAINKPLSPSRLASPRLMSGLDYEERELPVGVHLVSCLRRVAGAGGSEIGPNDGLLAAYLFSSEPLAVRQANMRKAMELGEQPAEVQTLEEARKALAKLPEDDWQ